MRTREEQIEVETDIISKVVKKHINRETCKSFVHRLVMEAERRAEQRVRAEIARDSERLDWLENVAVNAKDVNIHCLMNTCGDTAFGICGSGNYESSLREAIDAAREMG
nr:hypothetical protein [Acetobacter syzygii]